MVEEVMVEVADVVLGLLIDLVYPRRCPVCDKVLRPGALIHKDCEPKLKPVTDKYCMKCGRFMGDDENEYCYDCREREHNFDKGRTVFEYQDVAKAIYKLKYSGRREYAEYFGKKAAEILKNELKEWDADAIIPVPIHKNRMRSRGYNQAYEFAKTLGKYAGIRVDNKLIKRIEDTKPLKFLNPAERQNNLKKAFKIGGNDVKLSKIIVVDDIYTTGSTIDTVARVLKENGVRSVYFVTLTAGKGL
ncbi:MAG: ComF family protein [Lachnospiraceae bacterium]|nr:ComF family protein [Lachnospiraceae bacterium]